ncbi:MAG: hypothetical protein ACREC6_08135 [Hyphomicrobiaceae bacterium]
MSKEMHFEPPIVYLIADHLNGVLAAGEKLLASRLDLFVPVSTADVVRLQRDLRRFIADLGVLEMTAVVRALQARRQAGELRRSDPRLRPIAALFVAGTTPLADAIAEFGDAAAVDFHAGDDTIAHLRRRGVIADDAGSLLGLRELVVTETYRLAGHIEMRPLMDLAATFLDVLDLHYEIWERPSAYASG